MKEIKLLQFGVLEEGLSAQEPQAFLALTPRQMNPNPFVGRLQGGLREASLPQPLLEPLERGGEGLMEVVPVSLV